MPENTICNKSIHHKGKRLKNIKKNSFITNGLDVSLIKGGKQREMTIKYSDGTYIGSVIDIDINTRKIGSIIWEENEGLLRTDKDGIDELVEGEGFYNCIICMEITKKDEFVILPCGHVFHTYCYDKTEDQSVCPTCRATFVKNGEGVMTYENGSVYAGGWKVDKEHGRGVMTYENGRVYDGNWNNGRIHGKGVMTYENGSVYEGEYENGKKHGTGKMQYDRGEVIEYDGEWKYDNTIGKCRLRYASGDVFVGTYIRGEMNGIMTYANHDIFDGELHRGERSYGKMKYVNGDVYEGQWLYGKRHGQGKFTPKDGKCCESRWEEDETQECSVCTISGGKKRKSRIRKTKTKSKTKSKTKRTRSKREV